MFTFKLEHIGSLWYYKIYKNGCIYMVGNDHGYDDRFVAEILACSCIEKLRNEYSLVT